MDVFSTLAVRFHFNGEFFNDGKQVHYLGGSEGMSYIDRDCMSLPELVGHLKDHCEVEGGTKLQWLLPGGSLSNDLIPLRDDKACLYMSQCIVEGGVAEIYSESPRVIGLSESDREGSDGENGSEEEDSDFAHELDHMSEEEAEDVDLGVDAANMLGPMRVESREIVKQTDFVRNWYSPSKGKEKVDLVAKSESSGSDYMPGDGSSSEEDEEASQILTKYKKFKKKLSTSSTVTLDDVLLGGPGQLIQKGIIDVDSEGDGNDTSYADSDDDDSVEELGSDGEVVKNTSKYPRFSKKDIMPNFALGMKFSSKKQFKKAVIKYALSQKRVIKFAKDEIDRVRAKCDWETCPWVCLLSTNSRTRNWQIASLVADHTCPQRMDNRMVTARRIAEKYEKMIIANPTWSLQSMKEIVQEEMFAYVSIPKLKRAKAIVMQKELDARKGQYQRVFDYQLELLRSNPGSTVVVTLEPSTVYHIFQRIYICLDACKKGFLARCRRVVGLDGCFFKGATNGELLCAIGRDANNQMYPIAWAVVEKENNNSWEWFCHLLCKDLRVGDGSGWVFLSDQQKGILAAIQKWAPEAEHRNCARHIYANWRKKFKNREWQKKFWKCAKATCPMLFNLARAKLAQATRDGAQAIMNTDPQHWSRAWFRLGSNCDSVDNNMCESFNKWIVEARLYPILSMLELIRTKVMLRIQQNRDKSFRWTGSICPNIHKKLSTYIAQAGLCHAICNGGEKFEVKHNEHRFTVNLETKECSCRYWQLAGLPCPHAIASIFFRTNSLDDYIAPCYSVDSFRATYSHLLEPVEGMHSWPTSDRPPPQAPGYVRMPGRPKKERKREPHEKPKATRVSRVGTVIRCRVCKSTGHNRSTCPHKPTGSTNTSTGGSVGPQPPVPNAMIHVSSTQQSSASTSSRKRKAPSSRSQSIMELPNTSATPRVGLPKPRSASKRQSTPKTAAEAHVTTSAGGSATIKVHARHHRSQASSSATVTIQSAGTAFAQAQAHEPPRQKLQVKRATRTPHLLLPPPGEN